MDNLKDKTLRIGTRRSPLALVQTGLVESALKQHWPELNIELVPINSDADWKPQDGEKPLCADQGGKGLFAKEIEEALMQNRIDCGVHSLKDMAAFLPDGLILSHFLPREDARDCLISTKATTIQDLPENAVIGTCSPRRASLLKSIRNDLKSYPFRGNVQTRIDKLVGGHADATILAMAGLKRLNIKADYIHPLPIEQFMPACGQGIVAIETRENDTVTQDLLAPINHAPTMLCAIAERAVLQTLDGDCHTPIAAHAVINEDQLELRAMAASPCGQKIYDERIADICTTQEQAATIGKKVGTALKNKLPQGLWE